MTEQTHGSGPLVSCRLTSEISHTSLHLPSGHKVSLAAAFEGIHTSSTMILSVDQVVEVWPGHEDTSTKHIDHRICIAVMFKDVTRPGRNILAAVRRSGFRPQLHDTEH